MIELVRINYFNDLREYVEIAYMGDEELLTKYHVDKYSLEEAVNETMRMIEITSKQAEMSHYKVRLEDTDIGYVTVFTNFLYSFGINTKYRKRDILIGFFDKIKEVLGNSFICMLYPNNTRAINWLKKNNMVEVENIEDNCVTLLNI